MSPVAPPRHWNPSFAANHERIAAFIVEPLVQGAAGMAMTTRIPAPGTRICDRYEVHLICDEIAVGCGRSGTFFAHEQAGIRPDFLCLRRASPAATCRSRSCSPPTRCMQPSTTMRRWRFPALAFLHRQRTGLPCRAGDAGHLRRGRRAGRTRRAHDTLERLLRPLADHPQVRHFRRRGMILAFDVDADAGFWPPLYREALACEPLLRPMGNTVYFMPPYILGDEDAAFLLQAAAALEAALV